MEDITRNEWIAFVLIALAVLLAGDPASSERYRQLQHATALAVLVR
jgi:hypothetical protein